MAPDARLVPRPMSSPRKLVTDLCQILLVLVPMAIIVFTAAGCSEKSEQAKNAEANTADVARKELDTESKGPPNIIVILADDLGYGDISVTGGRVKTPNIERLAAEGMRLTDFHTSGVVCSPTRAGLLTGRYQQRAGIPGVIVADPSGLTHENGLQDREITVAELLQKEAYDTAIFGKWHLGYDPLYSPLNNGFDKYAGFVAGNIDYFSHIDQSGKHDWWRDRELNVEQGYATSLINDYAVKYIEQSRSTPFFLYVSHAAPHYPYQGPDDSAERQAGAQFEVYSADGDVQATYREMVLEIDRGIGDIMRALERTGQDKNTLILFFSDNGANEYGSNAPYRGYKTTVWEGGHRVPFIARWPSKIPADTVRSQLSSSLDVMPTIMDIVGIPIVDAPALDGSSIAPLLYGERGNSNRQLYWNGVAMRDGDWKLVIADGKPKLFDLSSDPGELNDLSTSNPQMVTEMLAAIRAWQADISTDMTQQPVPLPQ